MNREGRVHPRAEQSVPRRSHHESWSYPPWPSFSAAHLLECALARKRLQRSDVPQGHRRVPRTFSLGSPGGAPHFPAEWPVLRCLEPKPRTLYSAVPDLVFVISALAVCTLLSRVASASPVARRMPRVAPLAALSPRLHAALLNGRASERLGMRKMAPLAARVPSTI